MPLKRSRPKTEQKFQEAVLEIIAADGCGALGINAVAQRAGSDKVLIYRYFGDFEGLLETVANNRQWLPIGEDIINAIAGTQSSASLTLRRIEEFVLRHFRSDESLLQMLRWRRADRSALGKKFNADWHALWNYLPKAISQDLENSQAQLWKHACAVLALLIEAELCGESTERDCLTHITNQMDAVTLQGDADSVLPEVDTLPTNLL